MHDDREAAGKVLANLSHAYAKHARTPSGALERESPALDYQAAVVLFSDMDAKLPGLIKPNGVKTG